LPPALREGAGCGSGSLTLRLAHGAHGIQDLAGGVLQTVKVKRNPHRYHLAIAPSPMASKPA
jgi:hypothetical protein